MTVHHHADAQDLWRALRCYAFAKTLKSSLRVLLTPARRCWAQHQSVRTRILTFSAVSSVHGPAGEADIVFPAVAADRQTDFSTSCVSARQLFSFASRRPALDAGRHLFAANSGVALGVQRRARSALPAACRRIRFSRRITPRWRCWSTVKRKPSPNSALSSNSELAPRRVAAVGVCSVAVSVGSCAVNGGAAGGIGNQYRSP